MHGFNRTHAILGTSEHCIATHPSDFAVALVALDAVVHVRGARGAERAIPFADFHLLPGPHPERETTLQPGELITSIDLPALPFATRSLYLKVRDRASYAFALASAAVALDLDGGAIRDARVALGGVGTKPWRSHEAERRSIGKPPTPATFARRRRHRAARRRRAQGQRVQGRAREAHARPRADAGDGMSADTEMAPSVGAPIDRVDGRLKVTGGARYAAEYPVANVAHAVMITSTIARGKVARWTSRRAEKAPGVIAVLTPQNAPRLPHGPQARARSRRRGACSTLLQDDRGALQRPADRPRRRRHVRACDGGGGSSCTRRTRSRRRARYRDGAAGTDHRSGQAAGGGARRDNARRRRRGARAGATCTSSTRTRRRSRTTIRWRCTPPSRSGRATCSRSTIRRRASFSARNTSRRRSAFRRRTCASSRTSRAAASAARAAVVARDARGDGGAEGQAPGEARAHAAADVRPRRRTAAHRATRHARREEGRHAHGGAAHEHVEHVDARELGRAGAVRRACCTRARTRDTDHELVRLNVGSPTFMRAPGESTGTFALESAMDELAYALQMDPIALRLKNYAEKDPESGKAVVEQVAARVLRARRREVRLVEAHHRSRARCATATRSSAGAWRRRRIRRAARQAAATARILPDGTCVGARGLAGDRLRHVHGDDADRRRRAGHPVERVRFELGDTDMPEKPASAAR